MKTAKRILLYFSRAEKILWVSSAALIIISFALFDRVNYLTLFVSLTGVTSIIFSAKGNPVGQFLMIIFSLISVTYLSPFHITAK